MAGRLTNNRRRAAWLLLVLAVVVLHGVATRWLADSIAGWGEAAKMPERLTAVFVREVKPTAPPPQAAPAPPAAKPRRKARARPKPPAPAASQPQVVASAPTAPEPAAPASAEAPASEPQPEFAAAPVEQPPAAAAAAASAPPPVEWPAQWPTSTRLTYTLTGWFRGEVHGKASVEWLRAGTHYQVHLDVSVGPSFAPFMSRRMSSDGELTADGLAPRRYDEETRIGFGTPRHATIRFESGAVMMPNGRRRERWPGLQDAASQFVHLSWLFTTQPQQLAPGQTIEVPLALPRSIDRWVYDVLAAEDLQTSFGALPVLHLKPRRVTRPGGDMVLEAWFAPTLLYLPVRIRIHQDAETFVDLMIARPPLQAGTRDCSR